MAIRIAIVGGGLAGLITSLELSKKGVPSYVFEKRTYPFHKVCGEYVSNEVVPYLKGLDIYPERFNPPAITHFELSSVRGHLATMPLDLGGFGISRYNFEDYLYEKAKSRGVKFSLETEVVAIEKRGDKYLLKNDGNIFEADVVIGSFGKRSKIDVSMQREFIASRSPYVGVKYHARYPHPKHIVALHNFPGGYCGVASIEGEMVNICYLAAREQLKKHGSIRDFESAVLMQNPILKKIFTEAQFTEKPLVINEISFRTKQPVEREIMMVGDAAGMVAPIFGNGMAIAIRTGKTAGSLAAEFFHRRISRKEMEMKYASEWKTNIRNRLWLGRNVQRLFGNAALSNVAVKMMLNSKLLAAKIIQSSHGASFS
ncbi:MAG TPA: NAD(P)/FAD-dependent oxidoreductase [Chryseosolibacter sp.]|nr:NAD(P)/FAD-dependent oxidoreductase [Chryseosolibacter sp.]